VLNLLDELVRAPELMLAVINHDLSITPNLCRKILVLDKEEVAERACIRHPDAPNQIKVRIGLFIYI